MCIPLVGDICIISGGGAELGSTTVRQKDEEGIHSFKHPHRTSLCRLMLDWCAALRRGSLDRLFVEPDFF